MKEMKMSKMIRVTDYMKEKHPEEYAEKFSDKETVQEVKDELVRRAGKINIEEESSEIKTEFDELKVEEPKKKKSRRSRLLRKE